MRSNKRKPEAPQEEGSPAWMTTYADMITLVLTFFVLLFSFSTIDALKWKEIVSSLSGTPFVAIQALDPGGTIPAINEIEQNPIAETPAPTPLEEDKKNEAGNKEIKERFDELYQRIKNHIEKNRLEYILNVTEFDDKIVIRMSNWALFDSGKDMIKKDAAQVLNEVCGILGEYTDLIKVIRIEGHTDNVPISTARFENNWQLSTARAYKVLMHCIPLLDIDPAKMSSTGLGEFHPIATNETEEGKAQNRRVEFIIESINKE